MKHRTRHFEKLRRLNARPIAYLVILCCASAIIYLKLTAGNQHTATTPTTIHSIPEQLHDADLWEPQDPMPMLAADLIPWGNDQSTERQTSYQQNHSRGRVLIVRGILTIFSLGMDELAKKMRNAGYEVKVTTAAQASHEAQVLRDHVLAISSRKPIIIIGHSLGGDKAPGLAKIFAEKNVPIDVLFMLDSTMPSAPPGNVVSCVNMFQDNGTPDWARLFRGTRINAAKGQTNLINVDIRQLAGNDTTAGINHFNIDANPWIHSVIIDMVGQLLPLPANANAVPRHSARGASHIPSYGQPQFSRNP